MFRGLIMSEKNYISIHNSEAFPVKSIPIVDIDDFRETVITEIERGKRLASFFGRPLNESAVCLTAVIADDKRGCLQILSTEVEKSYQSLTPDCSQANCFEREIAEQWGIVPLGHPWFKPLRFHHSYRKEYDAWERGLDEEILPAHTDFYQVSGDEVHEVAVGPVHAGVIEPGHFRFQCSGERVFHLEIALGFQHRGIERAIISGDKSKIPHYMETLAGDTTIGHSVAYAQAMEALSGCLVSGRAQILRGIMLELERMANHVGDIGALANDVAFLPTASYCGRLRGDYLNMTAMICGNRFGRNMVRPGGVMYNLDASLISQLSRKLEEVFSDTENAIGLMWDSPSAIGRFEDTGKISREIAEELGLVGVAARACGFERDVRFDFPTGIYCFSQIPVATFSTCDVFARAYVRGLEIQRSKSFICEQLETITGDDIFTVPGDSAPDMAVVSMLEGWRGEICHFAMTGADGNLLHYKVVDPSFHNWNGLAASMRNEEVSNFPICNKSFNLSYCGHDL